MTDAFDPARAAVLTIDLQNDFLHPEGAYGRAGQGSAAMAALPGRVRPVIDALRARGGRYVSAQFTLVQGPDGPLISPHLRALRPFLGPGDFAPGSFGNTLVDALADAADFTVEKVAYSAFYQTRLEFILRAMGIETLLVAGIVTNGGVASTLRDAHLRDIPTIMLADACAAFDPAVHDATLTSLRTVTRQTTCAEAVAMLEGAA